MDEPEKKLSSKQQERIGIFTAHMRELREIARNVLRRDRHCASISPTVLVHEVFIRKAGQGAEFENPTHLLRFAARAMRHAIIDHARAHLAEKRGGRAVRMSLESGMLSLAASSPFDREGPDEPNTVDFIDLDSAIRALGNAGFALEARILEMRLFAGTTLKEISANLGLSIDAVKKRSLFAAAWVHRWLRRAQ